MMFYGYFEESNGKKYFNIDNTHNNKKILQKNINFYEMILKI